MGDEASNMQKILLCALLVAAAVAPDSPIPGKPLKVTFTGTPTQDIVDGDTVSITAKVLASHSAMSISTRARTLASHAQSRLELPPPGRPSTTSLQQPLEASQSLLSSPHTTQPAHTAVLMSML